MLPEMHEEISTDTLEPPVDSANHRTYKPLGGLAEVMDSGSFTAIRRKWFERQRLLEIDDFETADNLLASLERLRVDLGVTNLDSYSYALIRESLRAKESQNIERSIYFSTVCS